MRNGLTWIKESENKRRLPDRGQPGLLEIVILVNRPDPLPLKIALPESEGNKKSEKHG